MEQGRIILEVEHEILSARAYRIACQEFGLRIEILILSYFLGTIFFSQLVLSFASWEGLYLAWYTYHTQLTHGFLHFMGAKCAL